MQQQNDSRGSPGQLNVMGSTAITPMKRVPILANFEEWMKMATDNKINAANSWNFALIDYFHDMSLLKEGDGVNFQKASCTLDGCVKIYTSRVDSVATETGRLLSGLADSADGKGKKSRESGEEDGEEGEDDGDEDEEGGKKKQRKKPARSHEATLAPSFASLQLKKLELEFAVDPLFKKASADFDEGGAKGLLLNHLSIDSEGRIVFDSSDDAGKAAQTSDQTQTEEPQNEGSQVVEAQEQEVEHDTEVDLSSLGQKFFPDLSYLDSQDICPSMKTFTLGSADLTIPFLKASDETTDQKRKDEQTPPLSLDPNLNLAEQSGIFLNNTAALGFDDDDDADIGGFDMPDDVGFGEGGEAWARDAHIEQQLRTVPADGIDDNLIEGNNADDYAISLEHRFRRQGEEEEGLMEYFDKAFNSKAKVGTKAFMTLEDWRIRKLQKSRQSEGGADKPTRRKEKEPFEIDFLGPMSDNLKELLETPPVSNSSISLSKAQQRTKGRNLLDRDDEVIDVRKLMKLWIKPKCRVGRRKGGYAVVDEGFGARGQQPTSEDGDDEGRKGDYDANFFADDEQILPFDGPLPIDDNDDDDDNGAGDDGMGFVDAREMLSPQPEQQHGDGPMLGNDADEHPLGSQFPGGSQDMLPGSFGSQLVTQQGRRLRPEYVNYARTAKKVDVRRLKENMWKGMSDILMKDFDQAVQPLQQPAQEQRDPDAMDVDEPEQQPTPESTPGPATPGLDSEMRFTSMISGLQKVYPEQQMKDISTSYCFICLLHLANEKGLVLEGEREGDGAMQEIRVRRDQDCKEDYEGE